MKADERSRLEGSAIALGRLLHAAAETSRPEQFLERGQEALLDAVEHAPDERPRARGRGAALLLAAAALSCLLVFAVWARQGPSVAYRVDGSAEVDGVRISAARSAFARVRFSEGSIVELHPGARLSVESTTDTGATLRLEQGTATAQVVHREDARWVVLAGPFWIRVVGTSFRARWDAARVELALELMDGEVEVSGGALNTDVRVSSGQRFTAVDGSSAWSVRPLSDERASPRPSASSAAAAPSEYAPPAASPEPRASADRASPLAAAKPAPDPGASAKGAALDWPGALARGEFARVVADAEARGIDACLSSSSPKDLRALADAARYSGKLDLAERTLLALRARSPSSSAVTAYLLGSLNEARGDPSSALGWYEQCLGSAGAGELAAEARAGRLRALLASQGPKAARDAAREYLRDYPRGVGAPTAKKILESE